ncbi:hypothetical protein NHG29_03020 [Aerococcaceae bacterium NML160702]|nr:hypothetical protein [Aerococcaceae bacterium NML160702]
MSLSKLIAGILYLVLQFAKFLAIFLSPLLGLYLLVFGGLFALFFVLFIIGQAPFQPLAATIFFLLIPAVLGFVINILEGVLEMIAFGTKETKD